MEKKREVIMHSRTAAKEKEISGSVSFFGPAYRERERNLKDTATIRPASCAVRLKKFNDGGYSTMKWATIAFIGTLV